MEVDGVQAIHSDKHQCFDRFHHTETCSFTSYSDVLPTFYADELNKSDPGNEVASVEYTCSRGTIGTATTEQV